MQVNNVQLLESGEMYLETILILSQKQGSVRSIDVCEYMNFSKPSVSRAVGLLKKGGYINVNVHGELLLTESGLAVAEKILERHRFLSDFLIHLGVNEEVAATDACKMEHDISDETFQAIKDYVKRNSEKSDT